MTKFKKFLSFLILILTVISGSLAYLYFQKNTSIPTLASDKPCIDKQVKSQTNKLLDSKMSNIIQLSKYNEICKSQITDQIMIFSGIPNKLEKVSESVINLQSRLYELSKFNLKPLIVIEPVSEEINVPFNRLSSIEYNIIWDKYFSELFKLNPDLDAEWIFLPESNTPIWDQSNFNINNFGLIVNQFGNNLKKYFPNNKLDLLFDSKSYQWNDQKWQKPTTQNFNQYLIKINKKLVDKIWLQGFPYSPRKSELTANNNKKIQTSDYLNVEIIKQTADYLEIKEIGINTGTFGQKYTPTKDQIKLDTKQREILQNNLIQTIETLKKSGYNTSLNLFLQNKLNTTEETNWSYLDNPESSELFRQFIHKLNLSKIKISIFDN